jgi:hypothetical protein
MRQEGRVDGFGRSVAGDTSGSMICSIDAGSSASTSFSLRESVARGEAGVAEGGSMSEAKSRRPVLRAPGTKIAEERYDLANWRAAISSAVSLQLAF